MGSHQPLPVEPNALSFNDEVKAQIEHDLKQYVCSLIKGGSQFKQTCVLVGSKLRDMTGAYGFAVSDQGRADKRESGG